MQERSAMTLAANSNISHMSGEILEKVTLGNDLSGLSPIEKVQYVHGICKSLGLNPATRPIQLLKFNGKEVPYVCKDATEQLRKLNGVSVYNLDTKIVDGNLYVVTAYARTSEGREDSSTGVIVIGGLKGEALANAMMKTETKAKRRVTLSICGLGFMDESEADSIPGARKVSIDAEPELVAAPVPVKVEIRDIAQDISAIAAAETLESLQEVYVTAYRYWMKLKHKTNLARIMETKDQRKAVLEFVDEMVEEEQKEEVE